MLSRCMLGSLLAIVGMTTFFPASCDPDYVGVAETTDVEGKVLLDGQPIEDARVVFIPFRTIDKFGNETDISYGTTDSKGSFTCRGDLQCRVGTEDQRRFHVAKGSGGARP